MVPRPAIASLLLLMVVGFGAWAGVPTGGITGKVTDSFTGESIFGARVDDVTDADGVNEIPGSFAGDGAYFLRGLPQGTRLVRVRAPGYTEAFGQVEVDVESFARLDFELVFDTSLNTAEIILPIGQSVEPPFLFPPIVEAVQDGKVVGRTFVRAGNQYRISGIPNGTTTFRSASAYYDVGTTTIFLSENQTFNVTLPVSVPSTRGPITGSVAGVVKDLMDSPVAAHVIAAFIVDSVPVTVSIDNDVVTGVYQIALLPPGAAEVKAHAISTTDRSLPASTTIVGGNIATKDLVVFPFDPMTANFIPIVENPTDIVINEDDPRVLIIGEFTVTDLDHNFSADHTLVIYTGFNYTRSNIQPSSTQITPVLDWNGSLAVPVGMSDPFNTSAPFILTVTVDPVTDLTVYVDFDNGSPAGGGGTGGAANPFLAVGEALSAVKTDGGGTILIKGIAPSTEPPFTVNQDVSLQNNNSMGEVVTIAPSGARQARAASPANSGFVTRSGGPSRNHRFGT